MKALKQLPSFLLVAGMLSVPALAANLNAPGVPNFHQVNANLYRGGQPTGQGWHTLAKLGVKTVVDLRMESEHSAAAEAKAVEAAGMKYLNFPMRGVLAPEDGEVRKLLALFDTPSAGPVFVHCRRGADRTGTVIGCYRVTHDHWQNERALQEAKSFGMSWTQIGLKHYLKAFRPAIEEAATQGTPVGKTPVVAAP